MKLERSVSKGGVEERTGEVAESVTSHALSSTLAGPQLTSLTSTNDCIGFTVPIFVGNEGLDVIKSLEYEG